MHRMDSGFSMDVIDQQRLNSTIKEEDNHNSRTSDARKSPTCPCNGHDARNIHETISSPASTPDYSAKSPTATSRRMRPTPRSPKSTLTTPRRTHKPSPSISSPSKSHSKSKSVPSSSSGEVRSKPSSRRTSCTLVDPSRPTRHYRINSLSSQSASQEVDDVLALHFRSYALFHPPPTQSSPASGPLPSNESTVPANDDEHHMTHRITSPDDGHCPNPHYTSTFSPPTEKLPATATTTHFLLPSTRRKQYDHIHRSHSGFRGFLRKIVPCAMGPAPVALYEEGKENEAGSVRRFRIIVDEEDEEEEGKEEAVDFEKGPRPVMAREQKGREKGGNREKSKGRLLSRLPLE